ncbi:MAG: citrate transporter, partial [Streptococcaceae bacterium]|nr:citrate transporter [Streptococcaceae bacterium]
MLTILAYALILVFMFIIMKKKLSPFSALVIIPVVFVIIASITGVLAPPVVDGVAGTSNIGE